MEGQFSVPFHFAAEFLFLAVAAGACAVAVTRARNEGGWRPAFAAAGFGLLCVGQILHGARVPGAAQDGGIVLIVLRSAAFALIAALTPSVIADAAVMRGIVVPLGAVQLFSVGGAAKWSYVPGSIAAIVSVRAWISRRATADAATFSYVIAFALIAGGEITLAIAHTQNATALIVSHALRFTGALFLARWLQTFIARRIRLRFIAVFIGALVALILVLSASLNVVVGRNLQNEELARAQVTGNAEADTLSRLKDNDASNALSLASLVTRGLAPGRGTASLFGCFYRDVSFFVFVDTATKVTATALGPSPRCLLTDQNPALRPEVSKQLTIPLAGTDEVQVGLRTGSIGTLDAFGTVFASVAVSPYQIRGRTAGVLVLGHVIDDRTLLVAKGKQLPCKAGTTCPEQAGDDLTILVGGRVVATTFDKKISRDRLTRELAGGSLGDEVRKNVEENPDGVLRKAVDVAGRRTFSAYLPLRRSFGQREVLAVLVVSRGPGALVAAQGSIDRILFLIALFAAVIAAFIASRSVGRLMRPIGSLTKAAEAVRRGDLDARVEVSSQDEIGALGRTFNDMASSLDRSAADLRAAAREESSLRARMEAIMQSMGDGVVATDAAGTVVAFNAAAEKMTGAVATSVLGKKLADVLTGDDGRGGSIAHAALSGRAAPQGTVMRVDGGSVPVALSSAPLVDASGAAAGRVVVLRDVSAEMQAERMKSEFLSNVSHELRTPLTPIKGYTEILRRKKIPKEKAESFLDGILESTARLERIVEILVEFAAMEAGRLKPRTEPVRVKAFLDEHVSQWKGRSGGRRFIVKIPARLPAMDADPRLLGKCFDELIDNAVKFSPKGGRVEIEAHAVSNGSRSPKGRMVRIDIRDHGIGIAPEQMSSLFLDFHQIDGSETREFGGLGLGLAYAKRVASVHGGDVSAQSSPGKGSTFSLLVPASDTRKE